MIDEDVICGGTSKSYDDQAPKTIHSDCMTFFSVKSDLQIIMDDSAPETPNRWINYIYAFALPVEGGTLLYLLANDGYNKEERVWSVVKCDIFPKLVTMVREKNLAKSNGRRSFTNGLPKNYGGEVKIKYENGEVISYANNQSPVVSKVFARELYTVFTEALNSEKLSIKPVERIKTVRYSEGNSDEQFTRITFTDNGDGSCHYERQCKYESSQLYEDEKTLPDELMKRVREIADNNGMLIWDMLPEAEFHFGEPKHMTFVFDDDSEITVSNDRLLPEPMSRAFFAIELELTTQ